MSGSSKRGAGNADEIDHKRVRLSSTPASTAASRGSGSGPKKHTIFTLTSDNATGRIRQRKKTSTIVNKTDDTKAEASSLNDEHSPDHNLPTENDMGWAPGDIESSEPAPKKRMRTFENVGKLLAWLPLRQAFLDELLRHDGHADFLGSNGCSTCSAASETLFKCRDCWDGGHLLCRECMITAHASNPFHVIESWTGTHFEKTSLAALGHRYQLGHGGGPCPHPSPAPTDFQVFHSNGVHPINLDYCECPESATKLTQLLRSSLFPATLTRPQTAFTFDMLDTFHQLTLQAKTTAYDYYTMIVRRSDALALKQVPSRGNDFHQAFRFWRVLMMLKRAGRGNDPSGAAGTGRGELVVVCPACPHPNKNLPQNWQSAGALLFLYTLFLAVDANFKLKGKDRQIKDVELLPGNGAFVEESEYQEHLKGYVEEPEINTCHSEHDAIVRAAVRQTPGYSVTGAGLVVCSRHGFVRPNGAGDLQKGEKYANMDFIILSSLIGVSLLAVAITYDIACQWRIHLESRVTKMPERLRIDTTKTKVISGVPSWHINAHGPDCQTNHAFLYKPGSGHLCGEEIETFWAQTNILGASLREMGSGGRHEALNDHWNGMNVQKKVQIRALLLRKLKEAVSMCAQLREGFSNLSATFSPELLKKWELQIKTWEADPSASKDSNPYSEVQLATTIHDVRLALSQEDTAEASRGIIAAHQVSVTSFLMTGLELEEQQRALCEYISTNRITTSKQKADLEEKRTGLQRRINRFREVQLAYSPCVSSLLPILVETTDAGDPTVAEKIPLHLPSALPPTLRQTIPDLTTKERRLREAQCDDALADIRRQRRILAGLVQFKKLNLAGQGNKPNTRVRSLYMRVQAKITKSHQCYQRARGALMVLDPGGEWGARLKELHSKDLTGPGREEGESNTRFQMSWIWMVPRASTEGQDALEGDELDESLRVEWAKSRARLLRWEEELLLVQEEMRRAVEYLRWESDWWRQRAEMVAWKSPDVAHGITAYAWKQSVLSSALSNRFSRAWTPVLVKHGLTPGWTVDSGSDSAPSVIDDVALGDELSDGEDNENVDEDNGDSYYDLDDFL